jgi:hypothetical protein
MTPIYLNTTRVRAREGYSCVCRHHPSSVIGGDPRERGVSRPRLRPQDFPGAGSVGLPWRWRGAGFAESLGAASDSLAAIVRTGGLPIASTTFSGHPLLYTGIQTRLKVLGFVHSTDRIARKATVQSHGAGLSRGLVPPLPPCRPHGGWGRECARATLPRPSMGLANADGWGRKRVGDRSFQDPARTISAQYPPAELNFIAKIFQKNPPRCRSCWKLIAADIWGCCSIFECWKMTNRCDEFATMNQCLQPLG